MEVNNTRTKENAVESNVEKSEDHKKLLEYGIHELVADRLDDIYKSGKIKYSSVEPVILILSLFYLIKYIILNNIFFYCFVY